MKISANISDIYPEANAESVESLFHKIKLLEESLSEAVLDKERGVNYDQKKGVVTLKLRRLPWKRFWGFAWGNAKKAIECVLTIKNVEECTIQKDPEAQKDDVQIFVAIKDDNLILIGGGMADHDADRYMITIKVKELYLISEALAP